MGSCQMKQMSVGCEIGADGGSIDTSTLRGEAIGDDLKRCCSTGRSRRLETAMGSGGWEAKSVRRGLDCGLANRSKEKRQKDERVLKPFGGRHAVSPARQAPLWLV